MSAINGLPAAFTEINRLKAQCEAMRVEKLQIERGLAMLGTDDPTNVVQRLNKELEETRTQLALKTSLVSLLDADLVRCDKVRVAELAELERLLREGRKQADADFFQLRDECEKEADGFRGEIYTLEQQLEAARAALADSKLEIVELKNKLFAAEKEVMAVRGQMDKASTEDASEISRLNQDVAEYADTVDDLQRQLRALQTDVAEKDAALKSANMWLGIEASANVGWQEQIGNQQDEIVRLNREVAEYADTVDDLTRQTRVAAGWSESPSVAEIERKEKVILKLTEERNVWKNRHAAVTQSAQRLRDELDAAQKKISIAMASIAEPSKSPLNPAASEFVPRSHLNPTAPAFVPSKPVQTLKEAVQARVAEKVHEAEAARKATVESFQDAVRARLTPTLTITEPCVIPDYKADWTVYKEFCISKIQSILNECHAAKGPANKVPVAIRLFIFVKDHGMPFLRAYKKFRLVVMAKCWEFKADENCTAELTSLVDWILDQFKGDHPRTSSYDCGDCARCFRYLSLHTIRTAQTLVAGADMAAVGLAPAPASLTTPIKRIPVPTTPAAPYRTRSYTGAIAPAAPAALEKRYRTRTRTGVIRRLNYTEESDSE
jgi:hypothetical protein